MQPLPLLCAAAILVAAFAGAVRADRPARLDVLFDFGEVAQGAVVEHEFPLRNEGDQPMRITGVQLTPPLTLARMPAVIAPKAIGVLRLRLDTSKVEGEYRGTLLVSLSGTSDAEREFAIEGKVRPGIEILPHPAFFLSTPKGTARSATLEIVNREDQPLDLKIKTPAGPDYNVRLEPIEPGRRYLLTLTVPSTAAPGRRSERIELQSSSSRKPIVPVGVNIIVRERVYTFPDAVDLGHLKSNELKAPGAPPTSHSQTLMVYQTGGRDFVVEARSNIPGLELIAQRGPSGDRVQLTISLLRGKTGAGPVSGVIDLRTNDPDFPDIKVPVTGAVIAD